jgi:hypothetical protein
MRMQHGFAHHGLELGTHLLHYDCLGAENWFSRIVPDRWQSNCILDSKRIAALMQFIYNSWLSVHDPFVYTGEDDVTM